MRQSQHVECGTQVSQAREKGRDVGGHGGGEEVWAKEQEGNGA